MTLPNIAPSEISMSYRGFSRQIHWNVHVPPSFAIWLKPQDLPKSRSSKRKRCNMMIRTVRNLLMPHLLQKLRSAYNRDKEVAGALGGGLPATMSTVYVGDKGEKVRTVAYTSFRTKANRSRSWQSYLLPSRPVCKGFQP